MFKSAILFCLVALPLAINGAYNYLFWQDLGSSGIKIDSVSLTPMPIVQPGTGIFDLKANVIRGLSGPLKTKIDIIRTIAGLALPVRCYVATLPTGAQVNAGSCIYDDLCKVVETLLPQFNPVDCLPTAAQYGIDCTCPMKLFTGRLDIIDTFNFPDATAMGFSFLASGDFDVTVDASDNNGPYGKLKIGFTVTSATGGK